MKIGIFKDGMLHKVLEHVDARDVDKTIAYWAMVPLPSELHNMEIFLGDDYDTPWDFINTRNLRDSALRTNSGKKIRRIDVRAVRHEVDLMLQAHEKRRAGKALAMQSALRQMSPDDYRSLSKIINGE